MEINYMLAYGSAEASLRLLWRFGLMEILLPIQVWWIFFSSVALWCTHWVLSVVHIEITYVFAGILSCFPRVPEAWWKVQHASGTYFCILS